jgi:phosphoserine/homoserine phosphotransferase
MSTDAHKPVTVCLDLEGVLVPEIWIAVAEKIGDAELRVTTREIADYDVLMKHRLSIVDKHGLTLTDIQSVIATMTPLEGAHEFVSWIRNRCQLIILSDTFSEFALPLMRQLDLPTIFCHSLEVDQQQRITNYRLRLLDQKRLAVRALKGLNFRVLAAGDSYNDTPMLAEADAGFFYCPPDTIAKEFPQFPVTTTYAELKSQFQRSGNLPA